MALNMLEEQVLNEGPDTIALIQFESVVGGGGVVLPPPGYMQGVRAICDKYDILLHCDEVMVGFGRCGEMFGFQNYDFVIPDIVTAAKGLSSAALPISMMATRKHIMEAFEEKPLGWGSTYQGEICFIKEYLFVASYLPLYLMITIYLVLLLKSSSSGDGLCVRKCKILD